MALHDGRRWAAATGATRAITLTFAGYGISMLAHTIAAELVHRGVAAVVPAVNSPTHPLLYFLGAYSPYLAWIVGAYCVGRLVPRRGWLYGVAGALIGQVIEIEVLVKDIRTFALPLMPIPPGAIIQNPWSFWDYALLALEVFALPLITCAAAALGGWLGERSARHWGRSRGDDPMA